MAITMLLLAGVTNWPVLNFVARIKHCLEACRQARVYYRQVYYRQHTVKRKPQSQFVLSRKGSKGEEAYDLVASGEPAHVVVVLTTAHCQAVLAFRGKGLPLVDLGQVAAAAAFVGHGPVHAQGLGQSGGEAEDDDGKGLHFVRVNVLLGRCWRMQEYGSDSIVVANL